MIAPIGANSQTPPFFHSRGKYTEGTASSDLQSLIDDLAGEGGTVFVCQPQTTISAPLRLPSDVILDFQGNTALLGWQGSDGVVKSSLVMFSDTHNARVVNVRVQPLALTHTEGDTTPAPRCADSQSDPIIIMNSSAGPIQSCGVRRLVCVTGEQPIAGYEYLKATPYHCFDVVSVVAEGHSLANNYFQDIFVRGVCNGVMLKEGSGDGAEIAGNLFSNWALFRCMSLITFVPSDTPSPRGFVHNTFEIFRSQTDPTFSRAGVRYISGTGNHLDHVFMWDWWYASECCTDRISDFHVTAGAVSTYINADSVSGLINHGTSTRVVAPFVPCADFVSPTLDCSCAIEPQCSLQVSSCHPNDYYVKYVAWIGKDTLCFCPTGGGTTCTSADDLHNAGSLRFSREPGSPRAPWDTRSDDLATPRHPPKILTWRDLPSDMRPTTPDKVLTWRDLTLQDSTPSSERRSSPDRVLTWRDLGDRAYHG